MKKLFQRVDSISARMLLSYFSILLVPLCVIVVIYGMTMNAIFVSRQETALNGLKESASIMTARLEELANISSYIYTDSSVNAIINRSRFEEKGRNIYAFYQAIDSLPSYKLTNQMIREVYIFFNKAEFVIKPPNAFAFNENSYYQNADFHGISYEDIVALSRQRFVGGLQVTEDSRGQDILLIRSIPNTSTPEGLIIIELNSDTIDSIMSTNDIGPGGGAYILNREGKIVGQSGDGVFDLSFLSSFSGQANIAYREVSYGGRPYLLCQVEERDLVYLTLTEKSYLTASVAPMRILILLMGVAAFLVGGLMCVVLWRQRSRVVKNIANTARNAGVEFEPVRSETHLLEATVNGLVSTVDTLRETMDRQQDALAQTVVQGCLLGTFPSRADMAREAKALAPNLEASFYHVVRVSLLDPWDVRPDGAQILPYRIFLKEFIAGHLHVPHVISDIDGTSFALLLTEERAHSATELAEAFCALSEQVGEQDWVVPSFSISDCCTDLWDVRRLYAQTEEITRYMALLERKGVVSAQDLPRNEDAASFPMETEIRLIRTIKGGTQEALHAIFDGVMEENLRQRTLCVAMLGQLFETLRRSVLRAVQEAGVQPDANQAMEALSSIRSFAGLRSYALAAQEQLSWAAETQSQEESQQIKETLQRLTDENLANPSFTLAMLSALVDMPESTLYRVFKDCFGMSFSSYLEQRRINRAFELLKEQVLIKDVAEQVGYISDHTFRRAFKRVMKVPPSEFAKLSQKP